jgi:hypothetical protein
LARERAALDAEEGCWLLCAWRSAAHVHLGYGSFAQYIDSLFGYKPRTTQEKLRVAEALEALPRLARALEVGALGWCAARELTRVAVAETESAWLDAARGKTLRELEALVASKDLGDAPDAPAPEPRPTTQRVLRFEVSTDTFATFREAMQRLRRGAGGSLDDDALLLAMARQVLGGPRDEGRSSYQVSLSVCGACGGGAQRAGGELVPVEAAVVEMAACDAQHLGEVVPRSDELVPRRDELVPRAAELVPRSDHVVPRAAELAPRAAELGPRVAELGPRVAEVVPCAAEVRAANENASLEAAPREGAEGRSRDALAEPNSDETPATRQSTDHVHVGAPNPRVSDTATDTTSVGTGTTPPPEPECAQIVPVRHPPRGATRTEDSAATPGSTRQRATQQAPLGAAPTSSGTGAGLRPSLDVELLRFFCALHDEAKAAGGIFAHEIADDAVRFEAVLDADLE